MSAQPHATGRSVSEYACAAAFGQPLRSMGTLIAGQAQEMIRPDVLSERCMVPEISGA
jgi:hypothetical protein